MRLQVIDPSINFACGACTLCCDQPWRTEIEPDKAAAVDRVDWGAEFPALKGRELYRTVRIGRKTVYELAKGEGNRCIFLDDDNLCMIHKKLGHDAKPKMCKQFPFFPATAWDADYVSANFGCRAIQRNSGSPVTEQADAIQRTVSIGTSEVKPDAPLPLTPTRLIPGAAAHALREVLVAIFASNRDETLVEQLATALATMERAVETPVDELESRIASGSFAVVPDGDRFEPFSSACHAPMQSRFLFAATLFPDALPPDSTHDLGFFQRLTIMPKLMTLAKMRGVYPSRLLGRNVKVDDVLDRPATASFTPEATELLRRYLRSRIWQQFPGGTHLPLLSGLHQHIIDLNAVVFYALALRGGDEANALDLPRVEKALTLVEFHLATQRRLYTQVLKGWFKNALGSPELAWCSLRMIRCGSTVGAASGA